MSKHSKHKFPVALCEYQIAALKLLRLKGHVQSAAAIRAGVDLYLNQPRVKAHLAAIRELYGVEDDEREND